MIKIDNIFYVYCLIEPITNTPFYVGKGCNERCYSHVVGLKRIKKCKSYKDFKIQKILSLGLEPIVKVLHKNLTEEKAFQYEKVYIKLYGRKDIGTGILCNHTNGGEGSKGYKFTEIQLEQLSKSHKGQIPWIKGNKHSDKSKEKNRTKHLGKKSTINTRLKQSESQKKIGNRPPVLNNRIVLVYNLDNVFVESLFSIRDVCSKYKISGSKMNKLLKTENSSYKNFKFVYGNDKYLKVA